jgi:hypothetical protein
MSTTDQPTPAPVTRSIATARAAIAGEQILGQSRCVDWLLDCLNAARRPGVRTVICEAIASMSEVRALTAADFRVALDSIQLAVQVDAAFDHLDLAQS